MVVSCLIHHALFSSDGFVLSTLNVTLSAHNIFRPAQPSIRKVQSCPPSIWKTTVRCTPYQCWQVLRVPSALPHTPGLLVFEVKSLSHLVGTQGCGQKTMELCATEPIHLTVQRVCGYVCSKLAFPANALWIKATPICLSPLKLFCFLWPEWCRELFSSDESGKHGSKDRPLHVEEWEDRSLCLPLED